MFEISKFHFVKRGLQLNIIRIPEIWGLIFRQYDHITKFLLRTDDTGLGMFNKFIVNCINDFI